MLVPKHWTDDRWVACLGYLGQPQMAILLVTRPCYKLIEKIKASLIENSDSID